MRVSTTLKRALRPHRMKGRGRNGNIKVAFVEIYRYPVLDEVAIVAYSRVRSVDGEEVRAPIMLRGTTGDMRRLYTALGALLDASAANAITADVKAAQAELFGRIQDSIDADENSEEVN